MWLECCVLLFFSLPFLEKNGCLNENVPNFHIDLHLTWMLVIRERELGSGCIKMVLV